MCQPNCGIPHFGHKLLNSFGIHSNPRIPKSFQYLILFKKRTSCPFDWVQPSAHLHFPSKHWAFCGHCPPQFATNSFSWISSLSLDDGSFSRCRLGMDVAEFWGKTEGMRGGDWGGMPKIGWNEGVKKWK